MLAGGARDSSWNRSIPPKYHYCHFLVLTYNLHNMANKRVQSLHIFNTTSQVLFALSIKTKSIHWIHPLSHTTHQAFLLKLAEKDNKGFHVPNSLETFCIFLLHISRVLCRMHTNLIPEVSLNRTDFSQILVNYLVVWSHKHQPNLQNVTLSCFFPQDLNQQMRITHFIFWFYMHFTNTNHT